MPSRRLEQYSPGNLLLRETYAPSVNVHNFFSVYLTVRFSI